MSSSQQLRQDAAEITGQVQLKKDEYLNNVSHAMNQQSGDHTQTHNHTRTQQSHSSESDQSNPSIISQATNVLQQTGGQVKNMAQGAADAVKNTLGMTPAAATTTSPSSPSPSSPAAGSRRPSNPGSRADKDL